MNLTQFLALLPDGFDHEIENFEPGEKKDTYKALIRTKIADQNDIIKWKNIFSENTRTNWICGKAVPISGTKLKLHKAFECQNSNRNKVLGNLNSDRERRRGWNCKSTLTFRIFNIGKRTLKRSDPNGYLKRGLTAQIKLNFDHSSHPYSLECMQGMSYLRARQDIKMQFCGYFERKLNVADAMKEHEDSLIGEHQANKCDKQPHIQAVLSNASINPGKRVVQDLFEKWRENKYGPPTGPGVFERLDEMVKNQGRTKWSKIGNQGYPSIIMTDDSKAERKALASVWLKSILLLCQFHVPQTIWRWLKDKENNIEMDDRTPMLQQFLEIMRAPNEEEMYEANDNAMHDAFCDKYPHWSSLLIKYFERRKIWCTAYRTYQSRGHFTNNFAEAVIRLFKDVVIRRNRAYNLVQLVEFVVKVLEEYYQRRLAQFVRGNDLFIRQKLKPALQKALYLTKDKITQLRDDLFVVPSEKEPSPYLVNAALGYCPCRSGVGGRFCKHLAGIYKFFPDVQIRNAPDKSDEARMLAAFDSINPNARAMGFVLE